MNLYYEYYAATKKYNSYPAWVKSEGYFNCEHFSRIISLFRNRF